jgi:hypothetical protein
VKYKVGSKVQWKWLGREIAGVVREVHKVPVVKLIKGKSIKRNGSPEKPAYLVESTAGNLALKLETELMAGSSAKTKKSLPTMFD